MPLVPEATMINPASQVAELVRVLVKGLRAFQMYLPNNPVYQRATQSIQGAFPPVWEFTDHLVLAVAESQVIWEHEVVYEQESRGESFSWLLYKDGLRFLTLHRGVEVQEIGRFLQVVNQARLLTADSGDDLLTLLWAEDFQHIEYRFVEILSENVVVLDPQGVELEGPYRADETAHVIREEVQQERTAGVVDLEEFDSTLYFLEEAEVETLRREVSEEYARDVRASSLDILFDVFELHNEVEVREEVLGILEQLLPGLLANGEYSAVARILRELRAIAARVVLAGTEVGERFERFEGNLSDPSILRQILRSLDDAATAPADADIGELLRELRAEALATVAAHLVPMRHPTIRQAMGSAAERLVAAHPREAVRLLGAGDPEVLEGLVPVVGRAQLAAALPALGEVLRRPEPAIRLAAVEALAAVGTPGAMGFLERSLEDEDRAVRLAGLTAVSARGWKGALKRLEAVVQGRGRDDLERAERRQFFEAYAQIAGAAALEPLGEILEPKGLFRRKENAETRTCAAYAVARIRTPEARRLLERVQNDKELAVRNAAMRALREWTG